METIPDKQKIAQMIKDKQALDTALAFDLLEIFDDYTAGLRHTLQFMAETIFDLMNIISGINNFHTQRHFYLKWFSDWSNYGVATKNVLPKIWNHKTNLQRCIYFDAQDVGDMIRIWGECVEDKTFNLEKWNGLRLSAQKGPKYFWTKFAKDVEQGKINLTGRSTQVVGKKGEKFSEVGRQRFERKKLQKENKNYTLEETEAWKMLATMPFSGIKKWKMAENDPLTKMNHVFGLMPGATISGTTSDNIFFMNLLKIGERHPIFYLLPLATIVSGGHHSFLEVAYVLSLNNIIDYNIGLYSTLYPIKKGNLTIKGAKEIKQLLKKYDTHHYNHLMLISYDKPGIPKECIKFNNSTHFLGMKHVNDMTVWKKLALAKEPLLNKFRRMKPWPSPADISKNLL